MGDSAYGCSAAPLGVCACSLRRSDDSPSSSEAEEKEEEAEEVWAEAEEAEAEEVGGRR